MGRLRESVNIFLKKCRGLHAGAKLKVSQCLKRLTGSYAASWSNLDMPVCVLAQPTVLAQQMGPAVPCTKHLPPNSCLGRMVLALCVTKPAIRHSPKNHPEGAANCVRDDLRAESVM